MQHEQVRYDRDEYVEIDYGNLDPQASDMYETGDQSEVSGYGTNYDYYSSSM